MAGTWRDYLSLMESLGKKLDELTELERTKIRAVGSSDLEELEACMKQEQVVSLSLRGMDQKRDKLLSALGIEGVRLRDLVEHAPDELKQETKEAAEALRRQYAIFQTTSEASRNALEIHLHIIEELHKRAGGGELPHQDAPPMKADFRA